MASDVNCLKECDTKDTKVMPGCSTFGEAERYMSKSAIVRLKAIRRLAGEALMTQEVIECVASLVEEKGTDVWWLADTESLLPDSLKRQAEQYTRGLDTMDV